MQPQRAVVGGHDRGKIELAVFFHAPPGRPLRVGRRVGDVRDVRVRPASKMEAMLALGPNSLFQIPSRGSVGFDVLTDLVEQVPCFHMELGNVLEDIPRCTDELLAEVIRS